MRAPFLLTFYTRFALLLLVTDLRLCTAGLHICGPLGFCLFSLLFSRLVSLTVQHVLSHRHNWAKTKLRQKRKPERSPSRRMNFDHNGLHSCAKTQTKCLIQAPLNLRQHMALYKSWFDLKQKFILLAGDLLSSFCLIRHFCNIVEMFCRRSSHN